MNQILKLHEDLFDKEAIHTEKTVLDCFESQPLETKDVGFVSVPWSVLINHGPAISESDSSKIKKFCETHKEAFAVCQHIRYKELLPLFKALGITTVFTPHCDQIFCDGICIEPLPHLAVNGVGPAEEKDILFSFIGFDTHPTRRVLFDSFKNFKHDEVIIKERNNWHFVDNHESSAEEYKDVMSRTKFALCPRGTGPSTLRIWEAAQAGAIPVVISDDLVLPDEFWSVIRIGEKEFTELVKDPYRLVRQFQVQWDSMTVDGSPVQDNVFLYSQFSNGSFVSNIRDYYKEKFS